MDSFYAIETLVGQRLAEARAWAEREQSLADAGCVEPGLRERVGAALVRLGTAVLGSEGDARPLLRGSSARVTRC